MNCNIEVIEQMSFSKGCDCWKCNKMSLTLYKIKNFGFRKYTWLCSRCLSKLNRYNGLFYRVQRND